MELLNSSDDWFLVNDNIEPIKIKVIDDHILINNDEFKYDILKDRIAMKKGAIYVEIFKKNSKALIMTVFKKNILLYRGILY